MRLGIICLLIFLSSCTNEKSNSIIGNWQLTGQKYGTGAEIIEKENDFEYVLSFYNNGKYRESINGKQIEDRFLITRNNLILLINSKTSDSIFYKYNIDRKRLILDEVDRDGSFICDEGCTKMFERLKK